MYTCVVLSHILLETLLYAFISLTFVVSASLEILYVTDLQCAEKNPTLEFELTPDEAFRI